MTQPQRCPECGAAWSEGQTCADHFDLMLFWELDHQLFDVHHLMVVCFHLQHPSLYSPEGLRGAMRLLQQFVEDGLTPQQARLQNAPPLDSGKRDFKIKGTPDACGEYEHPILWTMTAADVVRGGMENYRVKVQAWANATLQALRDSGNLT